MLYVFSNEVVPDTYIAYYLLLRQKKLCFFLRCDSCSWWNETSSEKASPKEIGEVFRGGFWGKYWTSNIPPGGCKIHPLASYNSSSVKFLYHKAPWYENNFQNNFEQLYPIYKYPGG